MNLFVSGSYIGEGIVVSTINGKKGLIAMKYDFEMDLDEQAGKIAATDQTRK